MTRPAGHSDRVAPALTRLAESDPAFATLALWCLHRDIDADSVAKSDATTIGYGRGFIKLEPAKQVGVVVHHVLHIALRHAARGRVLRQRQGGDFDARAYNMAADAIVNEIVARGGFVQPRPHVTLDGVLSHAQAVAAGSADPLAVLDVERLYFRLRSGGSAQAAQAAQTETVGAGSPVRGASGSHGHGLASYAASRRFTEDLELSAGLFEPAGIEADDTEWQQRLARALEAGRAAGRGIGAVVRGIADLTPAKTPWEVHLRGLLGRALVHEPSEAPLTPARRWLAMDAEAARCNAARPAFLAGRRGGRARPRLAVGLDVSGSIDRDVLSSFGGQIAAIGARLGAELHLFSFDDQVRTVTCLPEHDLEKALSRMPLDGGGGTSFVDMIAKAQRISPSAIVVLTDLAGQFGDAPRGVPVIWAVPDAVDLPDPPFGRVIELGR